MTSHRYPPLPSPSQRDDSDRVGEILDTVRRIEARDQVAPTSPRGRIFAEVVAERERQEAKFPGQRLPLVEPDDEPGRVDMPRTVDRLRNREAVAREVCESRAKYGSLTWLDVLNEEVAEVLHSLAKMQAGIGGKEAARAELIQVAAVCFRILESEHFADAPLSDCDLRELARPREDVRCVLPSSSREAMSHVTHRIGWTESGAWIQHACLACRIGFLVAPGDRPPKCYQCGEEITRTTAAEAYRVWDEEDADDDNVVAGKQGFWTCTEEQQDAIVRSLGVDQ